MDVRDFVAASAAEFSRSLRDWLSIPSVSAGPAHHGGLDADRIHAPNEYVDLLDTPHRARWQESPPYLARINRKARRERS
jgi:hypothetical protein